MKKHLLTAALYTLITAVVLGLGYPLAITSVARLAFPAQADGELLRNPQGDLVGSALIGQQFTGDRYFNSRPSAAGTGYDAASSGGSNLGPTSIALKDRVQQGVAAEQQGIPEKQQGIPAAEQQQAVPVDLVTSSASGLDPDITPAAALYQVPRIAAARGLTQDQLRTLVQAHTAGRQFGLLGEPRVNVLLLNQALDTASSR